MLWQTIKEWYNQIGLKDISAQTEPVHACYVSAFTAF